jgi:HSP20 family protein
MSQNDPFGEIERLFDQFGVDLDGGAGVPVDVLDAGDAIEVTADLPGYETEDIDVQLRDGRRLTIAAEASEETEHEEGRFVTRERTQRATSRTITLPEAVDEAGTEAAYTNGVLTIRLPKQTTDDQGTDIPVN